MSIAESPPPATAKLHKRALGVLRLAILIGGIAGLLVEARLKATKPDVYAGIGEGG